MKSILFVTIFGLFLLSINISASTLYCSNYELCRMADILTNKALKTQTLVVANGDPHEFEPTTQEVKELLTRSPLLVGPSELHPWLKKIIYQRSKNPNLITYSLNFKTDVIDVYKNATHESLSHFWLYPDIYCQFKNDLGEWKWIKDQKIHINSNCNKNQIEQKISAKLKNVQFPIILSHDALMPLLKYYGKDVHLSILSLKGSGHHDEVSAQSVKELYSLMNKSKLIWIVEKNITIPTNIQNKIRNSDLKINIDTSRSLNEVDDFSILNSLFDEFK